MLKYLFKLIFPPICQGCNALLLKNEAVLCAFCRHELPLTKHHLNSCDNDTTKKFYGIIPIEFGVSMLYFHTGGIAQKLIHQLKYKGNQEIGTFLGKLYVDDLKKSNLLESVDEIIPVPLHKKRLKSRGYNQISTFCKAISNATDIPINEKVLFRNIHNKTQTQKNKWARQNISIELFDVQIKETDCNKHFLLVDDVITTGSTLEICCKALLKIPNAKVSILTIAYTQS